MLLLLLLLSPAQSDPLAVAARHHHDHDCYWHRPQAAAVAARQGARGFQTGLPAVLSCARGSDRVLPWVRPHVRGLLALTATLAHSAPCHDPHPRAQLPAAPPYAAAARLRQEAGRQQPSPPNQVRDPAQPRVAAEAGVGAAAAQTPRECARHSVSVLAGAVRREGASVARCGALQAQLSTQQVCPAPARWHTHAAVQPRGKWLALARHWLERGSMLSQ